MRKKAIVVGAGIVGLAVTRALSEQGVDVTVIERSEKAVGASIRNFGMVWPIGQPSGQLYNRAVRSRDIWKELADQAGIWYDPCGSMHLAYHADEWQVLQELEFLFSQENRPTFLWSADMIADRFPSIQTKGLKGGLLSKDELIVDPRKAIHGLPDFFAEQYHTKFLWKSTVTDLKTNAVKVNGQWMDTDMVWVCSGPDFETLFPDLFAMLAITKCKLQMMRFMPASATPRIGTAICGGLSLAHYQSFKAASSLKELQQRFESEMKPYIDHGIHVMVSQNQLGELTIGDSHEYGHSFDPFDQSLINQLILDYLATFMHCENWKLVETWNGIYSKMTDNSAEIFLSPEKDVFILNGLGGAGMTLSFGLAEQVVAKVLENEIIIK